MSSLEQLFNHPSDEFVPVPWWCWTGSLEPELLHRQLQLMYEQGIREFFIFPIYGMDIEYMSDEYLDRIGLVLDWCRELGMKVWIYDEYTWPSGTAGGRVNRSHPDAIASNIAVEQRRVSASDLSELVVDESVVHVFIKNEAPTDAVVDAVVFRRVRDMTVGMPVLGSLWSRGEPGFLDVLSEEAVRAFIDEAYEPIAKRFPEYLGNTLKGFFTDEPSGAHGNILWTDALPGRFLDQYGYDLVPKLQDLIFETPTSERTRIDYWKLISDMVADAFTGQIDAWCRERGLLFTGHMLAEENSESVSFQGDTPTQLLRMQIPGSDLLDITTSYKDPGPLWYHFGRKSLIKTPKHPASAARFTGRNRVMCEACGVPPWSRTMADEKVVLDWLVALGVNLINDNGLITDISGFRKRAISAKHFTQPWWKDAHLAYGYSSRLCSLSAATTLDTDILVMYPSTSWWAQTVREKPISAELHSDEVCFDNVLDALLRKHWDFEFLYEQILEQSEISDGNIDTGNGKFRCIVCAGVSRLRPAVADRLEDFAASGGVVVIVGEAPQVVDVEGKRDLHLPNAIMIEESADTQLEDALDDVLKPRVQHTWRIGGVGAHDVISAARVDSNGRSLLFVANMTPGEKELHVGWQGGWPVECWAADTVRKWRPAQVLGECRFKLPDQESVWFIQSLPDSDVGTEPPAQFINVSEANDGILLDGEFVFSLDRPNLYKPVCKVKADKDGTLDINAPIDDTWVDSNWGYTDIELKPELMKSYWVYSEFDVENPIHDLQLVVDNSDEKAAYLNGECLGEPSQVTVWEESNLGWEIGDRAKIGRNVLMVEYTPSPYYADGVAVLPIYTNCIEPLVLRGSFSVRDNSALGSLSDTIEPGDWRMKGFPHFAGTGIYDKTFTWDGTDGPALIVFDAGQEVAEVVFDGDSLGVKAWGPRAYRIDKLTRGDHHVRVLVTNTLGGLFRRSYWSIIVNPARPCGLLSPIRIIPLAK